MLIEHSTGGSAQTDRQHCDLSNNEGQHSTELLAIDGDIKEHIQDVAKSDSMG